VIEIESGNMAKRPSDQITQREFAETCIYAGAACIRGGGVI
jgi:hypothetical protein